jgi:hypothetical protein
MQPIRRDDLQAAVDAGIVTPAQADQLAAFLAAQEPPPGAPRPEHERPRFSFVHVLYYLGGMIAIGAMSLFMTISWASYGPWSGVVFSVAYGVLFIALTHVFYERKRLAVPAGIMATLAVVMVPLAIFCAQYALGYWEIDRPYRDFHKYIDGRWLMMELGTLAIGLVLFWRYRFPFMLMPIAVTLWYMSMDIVPVLFGDWHDWEIRKFISLWFGLGMVLVALWVDLRSRFSRDYAFWLYLFGVLAFWGGLSLMRSGSELGKFLYCMINVAMILFGAAIGRRVFAVFGGLGVAGYLCYLSWRVFRESLLFPVVLSAIGLAIVWLGVLWQKNEARWSAAVRSALPRPLRELIETRAVR